MKKILSLFALCVALLLACSTKKVTGTASEAIRLNQIGYYPDAVKEFIVADVDASSFNIIDSEGSAVFSGELIDKGLWKSSGEHVRMGVFTAFSTPGTYTIVLDTKLSSYPFEIKENLYEEAFKAAIKSFYFQRASMPIEEKYGGIYQRKAGHPDDRCLYHPSSGKTSGTLSSPGGWYDAGDYGKYTVNAALSVGQMLALLEQFPAGVPDNYLNIPESGNGISDLWDELKYELDWILTMQDEDGGVYHKLTAKNFSGFIMPDAYTFDRYIIGKGTAATLDFAAVLAQASRLYKDIDSEWAARALQAAEKAWKWALVNNNIPFKNPKDVFTGEYGDRNFADDFYWAAAELYISTQQEDYLNHLMGNPQEYNHQLTGSWSLFVKNVGFHSLLENRELLDDEMAATLKKGHLALADEIFKKIEQHPYHIGLDLFVWGSNSDVLNQASILFMAHRITGDEKYLNGAGQLNDYIFGKNATGFCFLTGFGTKQVLFPHHRPSGADAIAKPVPGFIVGGPNQHQQDRQSVQYTFNAPARSYMDVAPSYASNEVCLNWNAPAVYVLGYLQQVKK